jgi:hypothetical protein
MAFFNLLKNVVVIGIVIVALYVLMQYSSYLGASKAQQNIPKASNDTFEGFNNNQEMSGAEAAVEDNSRPNDVEPTAETQSSGCFPRDQLSSSDLLPKDAANSKWSQVTPAGQGALSDKNFLSAGHHFGDDTIGSSLRNPSHDLRGDIIANSQAEVSPWMQSTITPDLHRRPLQ